MFSTSYWAAFATYFEVPKKLKSFSRPTMCLSGVNLNRLIL